MAKEEEQQFKELKLSYWFTENKAKLKSIGIIAFIIIDLSLIVYGVWGFIDYYLISDQDRRIFRNWTSIDIRPDNRPSNILIEEAVAINSGINKYDLVAKIRNTNENYTATDLTYRFIFNNQRSTPPAKSFIQAGEEKYLMVLNYESIDRIREFTVVFDEVSWTNTNKLRDQKNVEIKISDILVTPLAELTASQTNLQRLTFTAYNNSIYNLWDVGFQIVFTGSQDRILMVNYIRTVDFQSFQDKQLELNIPGLSGGYRKINILPEVNIFDENNFKASEPVLSGDEGR